MRGAALTITTTVRASRDSPVPIAFGFHPYLRLPGVDRREWDIDVPVRERLRLDERMLPTGEREPVDGSFRRTWDTHTSTTRTSRPNGTFACWPEVGGGSSCAFVGGFPYAQVFATA